MDIINEAGLPASYVPVDRPPVNPQSFPTAPPLPNAMQYYFQGSISPALQHDVSFVGTQYGPPSVPNIALMPIGAAGSANTNSAVRSASTTSTIIEKVSAAGANGNVQFNLGGALGASSALNWDNIGSVLTVAGGGINSNIINNVFNVKFYGAAGNGTTDDTAAFSSTIAAAVAAGGGTVYVPAGTYIVSQIVLFSFVVIQGVNYQSTILSQKHGSNVSFVILSGDSGSGTTSVTDAGIRNLRLNCGSQTSTCDGIHFDTTGSGSDRRLFIQNVAVYSANQDGVSLPGGRGNDVVENVFVDDAGRYSFNCGTPDMLFSNCVSANSGSHGFYVNNSNQQFTNCKSFFSGQFSVAAGDGYYLNAIHRIQMVNCDAQDNGRNGFNLVSSSDCILSGCLADNNGGFSTGAGYLLSGSSNNAIIGCTAANFSEGGGPSNITSYAIDVSTGPNSNNSIDIIADGMGVANVNGTPTSGQLFVNGVCVFTFTIQNTTAATVTTPQNSPVFQIIGTYWNGSASANDVFTVQVQPGVGTNPQTELVFSHTGTSGIAEVLFNPRVNCANNLKLSSASTMFWNARSAVTSPADGILTFTNNANSGFTRLDFGGTTSSFPALQVSGTTLVAKLADGSADTQFEASVVNALTGFQIGGAAASGNYLRGNGTNFVSSAIQIGDLPSGYNAWSNLTNASTSLTLANGTNNTTFGQTNAATWLWSNTTAATNSANQSSPILEVQGTLWTGSVSANDVFSIQNIIGAGSNPTTTLTISHTAGGSGTAAIAWGSFQVTSGGTVATAAGSSYGWGGRARMFSPADGIITLTPTTGSGNAFTRLQFGGTTSSFPALQISGTTLIAKLADGSADTQFEASVVNALTGYQVNGAATSGNYLRGNGTNFVSSPLSGSDLVSASVNLTAQAANIAPATLFAVGASGAGEYLITVYLVVSQTGTVSATLPDSQIIFTDRDSGSTITTSTTSGLTGDTLSTFAEATIVVNAKASTNIQYATGQVTPYASVGATPMQYAVRIRAVYLG